MKTLAAVGSGAAPIVRLLDDAGAATTEGAVDRARAFTVPLVDGRALATGEGVLAHADGAAAILAGIGAAPALCAAAYLVHAAEHLGKPDDVLAPLFGVSQAALVRHARKLGELQRAAQGARVGAAQRVAQVEGVRKMLLAFSRDLRVVLLRLASRLQTLRFHAASKRPCPDSLAAETMQLFVPLANRLGIWQLKWELEDLCFRFLDPEAYRSVAVHLDERRADREQRVETLRTALSADLAAHGLPAEVQGRPKHLHSIWRKMRAKGLGFAQVLDIVAVRVIVADVAACYAVLGRVHERYAAIAGELDDYIARPKANGYRSLHTVVRGDDGRAVEIQIRTAEMHEHAEYGVAAHWAYKEGAAGSATASGGFEAHVAQARLVVLRQLLAWERDLSGDAGAAVAAAGDEPARGVFDDRIYVFTPLAEVVELTAGATPIDFAYALHTDLGHRCRGARVDGAIVPLNTPLANGQTVEINAAKTGGPSLDWLNGELGYLQSARSKAKVRAWFNALAQAATVARGREAVEKLLQREGRTAFKHTELAAQLGFQRADALFEVVGKDEFSLRSIEALLRPPVDKPEEADVILKRPRSGASGGAGGVLVVGVESLLTSLARCCRPAPPDAVRGYVTRGKGVAVHRAGCSNLRELTGRAPERVIPVAWGDADADAARARLYPVDVSVEASDRPGLLRDVSEVFAKEKMNVTGVKSQSVRGASGASAYMTFTIEVAGTARVTAALAEVVRVPGVRSARRR